VLLQKKKGGSSTGSATYVTVRCDERPTTDNYFESKPATHVSILAKYVFDNHN